MGRTSELKRLWRKYRNYRINRKERSTQATSGSSRRDSKDNMALDETAIVVVGLGLELKQEEQCIEYLLDDDDPRFIGNPFGIGCSKTYEEPYVGVINSLSTSPASMQPLVSQEVEPNEGDQSLSFPDLELWRSASIDMVKGKRKGRMPGDSADDRYKFLLDGRASRSRLSAKKFMLVKQRAWTR